MRFGKGRLARGLMVCYESGTTAMDNDPAATWQPLFFRPLRGLRGWLVYLAAVAIFFPIYFYLGGQLVRQVNLEIMASDQAANIWLARESKADPFPLRSSYIQPLWPWLSTFVMEDDDQAYFVAGKKLNLMIGGAAAFLIFVLGAALIAPVPGYLMGWIAGFAVFLQRCHFFHPEPLLYVLFAGAVLFMLLTLRANRFWYHAGWGICLGFAYLAKASVSPLLAVYAGATAVLLAARAGWLPRWLARAPSDSAPWSFGRHLLGAAGGLVLCAAIIAPNALYKMRVHDDPFFSPTKYWMWCDDWDTEAYLLHQRIWTAQARAEFPPGELPTMKNYLRKHGAGHAIGRLAEGMSHTAGRFFLPGKKFVPSFFILSQQGNAERGEPDRVWRFVMPARGLYLAALALMAAFLFAGRLRAEGPPLFRTAPGLAACAFVIAMTIVYWLAFGWYAVIGKGERFSLMLYLPLLVAFTAAGWLLSRDAARRMPQMFFAGGICVVLAHAIIQILRLLLLPQFSKGFS